MKYINKIKMANDDVCFQSSDNKRFRLRAAAIIIENGHVLFATNDSEGYYYSIGGGVHFNETAEEACLREVKEETGIAYEIERLAFVEENFFHRDDGMLANLDCHEITFYFLMKSRGTQELNSHSTTQGLKEYMVWLPLDKIGDYEAYPMFFAEKLQTLKPYVEHIVTHQNI